MGKNKKLSEFGVKGKKVGEVVSSKGDKVYSIYEEVVYKLSFNNAEYEIDKEFSSWDKAQAYGIEYYSMTQWVVVPSYKLTCTCIGYAIRKTCRHIKLMKFKQKEGK